MFFSEFERDFLHCIFSTAHICWLFRLDYYIFVNSSNCYYSFVNISLLVKLYSYHTLPKSQKLFQITFSSCCFPTQFVPIKHSLRFQVTPQNIFDSTIPPLPFLLPTNPVKLLRVRDLPPRLGGHGHRPGTYRDRDRDTAAKVKLRHHFVSVEQNPRPFNFPQLSSRARGELRTRNFCVIKYLKKNFPPRTRWLYFRD